jgi:hypothetical protein
MLDTGVIQPTLFAFSRYPPALSQSFCVHTATASQQYVDVHLLGLPGHF